MSLSKKTQPLSLIHKQRISWESTIRSNSQVRVFWILHEGENPNNSGIFTNLAYKSHWGNGYKKREMGKVVQDLKHQMYGGRALEIMLCESLIQWSKSFHFLPPRELDLSYKIDMCSRIPYRIEEKLHTFCIGTQVTIAPIPWNTRYDVRQILWGDHDKYVQKYQQMQSVAPYLHNAITRSEIKDRFGKLPLPDIICYLAVNGSIGKTFMNSSYTISKFHEWRNTGFIHDYLSDHFRPDEKEWLQMLAKFVDFTQKYLITQVFHDKIQDKDMSCEDWTFKWFKINIDFLHTTNELSFELINKRTREKIAKCVYMLTKEDMEKLAKKCMY